ncbi:MAG TPA: capsular biosynthesis protein [Sphingomicrobium sp.]|nr:capsular biosynthesis protein [Sphingomicrobium sp.]
MSDIAASRREFLFLQGPPGPFFRLLAKELGLLRHGVHRINLSGGDRYDWPSGADNYRGTMSNWPMYFDRFVRANRISDLIVYGDCRPVHRAALRMAKLRGIRVFVFEEGYIRPDWMTLERDGVNGHSAFDKDPELILASSRWLPEIPPLPPITADFRRRARDSYWHYHHVVTGRLQFPFYRTHRNHSIIGEGIGWLLKFARSHRRAAQAEQVLAEIEGRKFVLFPLQLTGDYQIRLHSPFGSMPQAVDYVLESFAAHAPADQLLLVKEHPLDASWRNWRAYIKRRAEALAIGSRVMCIAGGDLQKLSASSAGLVCVNSTSGTLALENGIPVVVLGDAVYDVPGITHQAGLDNFWQRPEQPDRELYAAFKKALHAKCLVRGGLASTSATETLIRNSVERLLAEDSMPIVAPAEPAQTAVTPRSFARR